MSADLANRVYEKLAARMPPRVAATVDVLRPGAAMTTSPLSPRSWGGPFDAHWEESLPLREDVEIIGGAWTDSILMIDDFEIAGDAGYGFDDYGPEKRLSLDYLQPDLGIFQVFWPAAPAAEETGARRGAVVLATLGAAADAASGLGSLRRHEG